eukprot:gene6604-13369_t
MGDKETTTHVPNQSLWEDVSDPNQNSSSELLCRVCHSEGEPDRPLYHPCKCDGSIKFVHQDCLVEWVRVSRQTEPKCELCGEKFHFKNVYAVDTPANLSFVEFCRGLFPRFAERSRDIFRGVVLVIAWFIILPLFTSWWLSLCTAFILDEKLPITIKAIEKSIPHIISSWWNGFVMTGIIVLVSISVTQIITAIAEEIGHLNTLINAQRELTRLRQQQQHLRQQQQHLRQQLVQQEQQRRMAQQLLNQLTQQEQEQLGQQQHPQQQVGLQEQQQQLARQLLQLLGQQEQQLLAQQRLEQEMVQHEQQQQRLQQQLGQQHPQQHPPQQQQQQQPAQHQLQQLLVQHQMLQERLRLQLDQTNATEATDQINATETTDQINATETADQINATETTDQINATAIESDTFSSISSVIDQVQPQIAPIGEILQHQHQLQPDDILHEMALVHGPIELSLRRFLTLCQFNALFIVCVQVIPVYVGRTIIQISGSTYWTPLMGQLRDNIREIILQYQKVANGNTEYGDNITGEIFNIDISETEELIWNRVFALFEWVCGLFFLVQSCVIILGIYALFKYDRHIIPAFHIFSIYFRSIWTHIQKWFKISIILALEGCILPQLIGWLIDIVTLKAFDLTLTDRILICHRNTISCSIIHWILGFLFMLHIGVITIELRDLIKQNLLIGILPESNAMAAGDLDESIFDSLGQKSISELARRFLLNTCFYVPGVLVSIMIPVRIGHYIYPFANPLKLQFSEVTLDVQLPLELLIFHVLVPFVLERMRHRTMIRFLLQSFLKYACQLLNLSEIILNPLAFDMNENNGNGNAGNGINNNNGNNNINNIINNINNNINNINHLNNNNNNQNNEHQIQIDIQIPNANINNDNDNNTTNDNNNNIQQSENESGNNIAIESPLPLLEICTETSEEIKTMKEMKDEEAAAEERCDIMALGQEGMDLEEEEEEDPSQQQEEEEEEDPSQQQQQEEDPSQQQQQEEDDDDDDDEHVPEDFSTVSSENVNEEDNNMREDNEEEDQEEQEEQEEEEYKTGSNSHGSSGDILSEFDKQSQEQREQQQHLQPQEIEIEIGEGGDYNPNTTNENDNINLIEEHLSNNNNTTENDDDGNHDDDDDETIINPTVTTATTTTTSTIANIDSSASSLSLLQPPPPPLSPSQFDVGSRCVLLVFLGLCAIAVGSSLALHMPLSIGRAIMKLSGFPLDHDLYNLSTGVTFIWGSSLLLRYILKDVPVNATLQSLLMILAKWNIVVIKVVILCIIWLSIYPLLVGVLFEAVVVVPLRTPLDESPSYPLVQCWALGLMFLKIWMRCVMLGAFGDNEWMRRFHLVVIRGLTNLDVYFILNKIFFPILIILLDHLVTPFFFARLLGMCIGMNSYVTKTLLVRFSFSFYVFLKLSWWGSLKLYAMLKKLHNEIRDSRYLLGTELTNR